MRRKRLVFSLLVGGLLAALMPAYAHHSWRVDRSRSVTVKGIVTRFAFSSPHVEIFFDVKDASGNIEKWEAGGANPRRLTQSGWTRDTLKPGDEITITGFRARDGSPELMFRTVALGDGAPIGGYRGR
jgi:hypothetical protein